MSRATVQASSEAEAIEIANSNPDLWEHSDPGPMAFEERKK